MFCPITDPRGILLLFNCLEMNNSKLLSAYLSLLKLDIFMDLCRRLCRVVKQARGIWGLPATKPITKNETCKKDSTRLFIKE